STVAEFLLSRGAEVVDVDALGREIIEPGGIAVSSVVDRFGSSVSGADGGIDRAALASIVFGDEEQLAALEEISHPAINELLDLRVDGIKKPDSIIIFDMAVLFESQLGYANEHPYEIVVVVEAPISDRLDRLETQRGVSREDALARIESQASDEERRSVAQFVIANGDDLTSLAAAVDELWSELEQLLASKQY
ncbi:MAG: dephospho-CoA kinase, partial [Actinomycetota bacterium]|nr:dephospho-CoA kinase [Actinomycetota bacterium]